ncbi:MAG: DUF3489 domain-containing protein [Hyphomonadaceae bacterium]|nr:DUF3489 domain-containing protein [Hyphomonadaceae bacterium]
MAKPAKPRTPKAAVKAKRAPSAKAANQSQPKSKLDQIIAALRSPKGATITQLMKLTDWQMHSVRGAIAGALKKKRGLAITSTKTNGERVYRIEAGK